MAVSPSARNDLYARLREVFGDRDASVMIDLLPLGDPDDVATKGDIGRLELRMERLDDRLDRFDDRLDRFDDKLDRFHAELREQARVFVFGTMGAVLSAAAIAFAAARFV
jgi:hypothetical protein